MMLAQIISPNRAVARSVNLERDMGDSGTLGQYILTTKGLAIIDRLIAGLNGEKISAWSLTGPYGMGKSSFANFLLALCGPAQSSETKSARALLMQKAPDLADRLQRALTHRGLESAGFLRTPTTASFQSVNLTLANGLRRALKKAPAGKANELQHLSGRLTDLIDRNQLDAQTLFELFAATGDRAGRPLVIVIDEFGKNLEFMARRPEKGDLYLLQLLAEAPNVYLWVCLHQAFDEYAAGFSNLQLREWGKIQGRFEDIAFIEPQTEMLGFIGQALVRNARANGVEQRIHQWGTRFYKAALELDLPYLKEMDAETMKGFYPLHPLSAVLLPELCVKFAQNDRTLFAFLCGGEPQALPAFLASQEILTDASPWATLPPQRLYDYFLSSGRSLTFNRPEARRWLEINTLIEAHKGLPAAEYTILRIIGLLNLISGSLGLRASGNMIRYAMLHPLSGESDSVREIDGVLDTLVQRGILNYREYADEYRLWEGTDFDVNAAIQTQKERLANDSLTAILAQTLPLTPLIASRHSYKTGTLRHFERQWIDWEKIDRPLDCESTLSDGLMLYCLGKQDLPAKPPAATTDGRPVVIVHARDDDLIRDFALHAAASKKVLSAYPELERDGVARREARFRARASEIRLKRMLIDMFTPGHPDVRWFADGRRHPLNSFRQLSSLLSRLCDKYYSHCPIIRNELINRDKLSGAAARARRELLEAMLNNESKADLGLRGTGPETAIYRTMLRAENLHIEESDGLWRFTAPQPESSFHKAWRAIDAVVQTEPDEPVQLTDLIVMLKKPPIGLKDGPIPVLITLYLFVHADEAALYQESAFIPYLGAEDLELMVKRPEFFTLKRFITTGVQGRVFRIYQELLNTSPVAPDERLRNVTMVGIVGPLVQFANNLPAYVKNTRALSREARNVRQVLLHAQDPLDLLFEQLPQALNLPPFPSRQLQGDDAVRDFQTRFRNAVTELADCFAALVSRLRLVVAEVYNEPDIQTLRKEIRSRAKPLVKRCGPGRLKPFLAALSNNDVENDQWLINIAAAIAHKPVENWSDTDIQIFITRLHDLHRRFRALEALVGAERNLPRENGNREGRHFSMTRPDGRNTSEVVWLKKSRMQKLKPAVAQLLETYGDKEDIKTLFMLLGEELFSETKK